MTLDDILFTQYQLGREHEAMIQRGEKRKVGGEITEAKKQIQKLLEKEYVRGINSASDMVTELEKKITENRPPDVIDLMQSTQRLFGGAAPNFTYTGRNNVLYKIEEVYKVGDTVKCVGKEDGKGEIVVEEKHENL